MILDAFGLVQNAQAFLDSFLADNVRDGPSLRVVFSDIA